MDQEIAAGVAASCNRAQRSPMSDSDTYKIVEIAGTSPDGVTEAMQSGVTRAAKTLRNVDWVEVRSIRGHVQDGQIAHFQVEMRIGFKIEG
jgi:flavin-binding protein dodecin